MSELKVSFPNPCDEAWEGMKPSGCNRECAVCQTTVHDLSALSIEEAERLLDSEEKVCVRARVRRDGTVALAEPESRTGRRMVAAIGASLAVAACQSTAFGPVTPRYQVSGEFIGSYLTARAKLTADNGRTYERKLRPNSAFKITNLPAGNYSLTVYDYCAEPYTQKIAITDSDAEVGQIELEGECIIVGVMERADPASHG